LRYQEAWKVALLHQPFNVLRRSAWRKSQRRRRRVLSYGKEKITPLLENLLSRDEVEDKVEDAEGIFVEKGRGNENGLMGVKSTLKVMQKMQLKSQLKSGKVQGKAEVGDGEEDEDEDEDEGEISQRLKIRKKTLTWMFHLQVHCL
jgi:hypothetical protein